jgi:RNA polymerase sigma-70 factor (ECF subfamily)
LKSRVRELPDPSTCWTIVRQAADGDGAARSAFARSYLEPVRAYFAARWRNSPLGGEVEDGVQEVFMDCFRESGALARVAPNGSFRAFLFGVSRNVALRIEERAARERNLRDASEVLHGAADRDGELSKLFDVQWARSVMRRAAELQSERARERGEVYERRVEILRLRFEQGLSIREIAARWDDDAARVHHEYAYARDDFKSALLEVIGLHDGSPPHEVEAEAARLMALVARPIDERFRADSSGERSAPPGL